MPKFVPLFLLMGLLLAFLALSAAPIFAQSSPSPNSAPALRSSALEGTVCDSSGKPVANASVKLIRLPEPSTAKYLSTKTAVDGTFTFSAISPGQFTLQAEIPGSNARVAKSVQLSPGETQSISLVLAEQNSSAPADGSGAKIHSPAAGTANARADPGAAAMQFADEPNFTVSGMTDYSDLGLHGSEATARTSKALTKETLALKKSGGEDKNAGGAGRTTDATAHRLAGDHAEKAGDSVAAVHEYEAAARLDASEENYFAWGSELLLHRAAQPAAEVFANGSAAHPDSARMLAGLGAALYAEGRYEDAANKFCGAVELNPQDAEPYLFLGQMEETAAAPIGCGEEKLARFAKEQPANALANYYYALNLMKRERLSDTAHTFPEIETLLQKASTLDPQLGEAFLQLGILYAERSDFPRAESTLQKAITAKPELGLAHYRLGQIYKRSGEGAKAQQEFALYAQCEKNEAEARASEQRELRQFLIILKDPAQPALQP
jgi:Flp pilus assembly protein TadD